ncbi:hypothetical protein BC828DRAFT_407114 [Blastocladiella britannica]|nr:hypothetical protein BC828DRAFT_407114 [Blastocladiella britannica]
MDDDPSSSPAVCRVVVHLDLDMFYAQCEELQDPQLAHRPLGIQQKQIIVTCNYHARALGVKKLMLVTDALAHCPNLVIRNGEDLTLYRACSDKVHAAVREAVPVTVPIERLGMDELFMDFTSATSARGARNDREPDPNDELPEGCHFDSTEPLMALGPIMAAALVAGAHWARRVRTAVLAHTSLRCSVGVSTSKLAAKIASGIVKPSGLTVMPPSRAAERLAPLPMRAVPGLGHAIAKRLVEEGLAIAATDADGDAAATTATTVGELVNRVSLANWTRVLGDRLGTKLYWMCRGNDLDAPVVASTRPTQLSIEDSFASTRLPSPALTSTVASLASDLVVRLRRDAPDLIPRKLRVSVRVVTATGGRGGRGPSNRISATVALAALPESISLAATLVAKTALSVPVTTRLVAAANMGGDISVSLINLAFVQLEERGEYGAMDIQSHFAQQKQHQQEGQRSAQTPAPAIERDEIDIVVELEQEPTGSEGALCIICAVRVVPWALESHWQSHEGIA